MAEHIISFSHVNDPEYADPKDKIPWPKNKVSSSYRLHGEKFILTTSKPFKQPEKFPEEEWR